VTMMLLMLTPYDCARHPVRRRATGLTDVTVHAVIVPSRSTGPSAPRRKCATQRECRVQYDAPARAGQRPALRLLRFPARLRLPSRGPQYEVSPIPSAQYGHAPLVWQANSSRRDDRAGQPMVKASGSSRGGTSAHLRFASNADLNSRRCCASRSARADVGHATWFLPRDATRSQC